MSTGTSYYYDPNNGVGLTSSGGIYCGKGTQTDGKADYSALPDVVKTFYSNGMDNRSKRIAVQFTSGSVSKVAFTG